MDMSAVTMSILIIGAIVLIALAIIYFGLVRVAAARKRILEASLSTQFDRGS